MPFRVAEKLGWPCLTQVVEIERCWLTIACVWPARSTTVFCAATLRLPCVLAVGNAVVSRLRVPTLTDRLAQRGKPIDVLSAADLGVDIAEELSRETCALTGLEAIDRARRGVIVDGDDAATRRRRPFSQRTSRAMIERP